MIVVDPGHGYLFKTFDSTVEPQHESLEFVKREGPEYPGNVGHHPGTNMQEVLRGLIHRTFYVHGQKPSRYNTEAIVGMRAAIRAFEMRAAKKHGRVLFTIPDIENMAFCFVCGHIGCKGDCRK